MQIFKYIVNTKLANNKLTDPQLDNNLGHM